MKVPFSPPDITEEEIAEVADTLRSGWITTGPKTKRFERSNPFCSLPHIYNPMQLSGLAFLWI